MSDRRTTNAGITVSVLRILMGLLMNFLFYALAVLIIIQLARTAYVFSYQVFGSQVMDNAPGRSIIITIGEDDTMLDVAKTLKQQKIIVGSRSFYVRALLTEKKVHSGTYTVNSSQNYAEILEILDTE